MKAVWTGTARQNVDEIWAYIAEENIHAADGLMLRFRAASELLEQFPTIGAVRPGKRNTRGRGCRYFVSAHLPHCR